MIVLVFVVRPYQRTFVTFVHSLLPPIYLLEICFIAQFYYFSVCPNLVVSPDVFFFWSKFLFIFCLKVAIFFFTRLCRGTHIHMRIELFDFDCISMKLIPVFRGERRIKALLRRPSGFEEDAECLPVPHKHWQFEYTRDFSFKKNDNHCYPNKTYGKSLRISQYKCIHQKYMRNRTYYVCVCVLVSINL